jgi:hypothetical protein
LLRNVTRRAVPFRYDERVVANTLDVGNEPHRIEAFGDTANATVERQSIEFASQLGDQSIRAPPDEPRNGSGSEFALDFGKKLAREIGRRIREETVAPTRQDVSIARSSA